MLSWILNLVVLLTLFVPFGANAHAFGQQYTLPLPANLYIIGGSLALAISFVFLLLSPPKEREYKEKLLVGEIATKKIITALKVVSLVVLIAAIAFGTFGVNSATQNITPTLFWICFMLGFAYISVFVQGLWDAINPFQSISNMIGEGLHNSTIKDYKHIPASVIFLVVMWLELASGGIGAMPNVIAMCLVAYALLNIVVDQRLGKRTWEEHFDMFGMFFRTLGSFAPIIVRETGIYFKKGIKEVSAPDLGAVFFVVVILAATAFDGFRETAVYVNAIIPLVTLSIPYAIIETLTLLLFPIIFFGIYLAAIYGVKKISGFVGKTTELTLKYGYSLIPIAIVYHMAHYFTLLLVSGQNMFALISDPFGFGWDLFGTKHLTPNVGILGADTVWYIQVTLIVLGHVIALFLSHKITTDLVGKNRILVAKTELPMLVIMVFYTAFGLWILSQPFAL